jgi:hypothetical protein
MFNRLPGTMLSSGHTHQWRKGRNCSRVLSQHTAVVDTPSHRLFNPAQPEAQLSSNKILPMLGTLGQLAKLRAGCQSALIGGWQPPRGN